mmetsp:Transcript_37563/g.38035  ORF Transcript_37563/g.38035 Transcript_37563/m.38035 type:complete len:98 (+) Transcript_37563:113-406(+)
MKSPATLTDMALLYYARMERTSSIECFTNGRTLLLDVPLTFIISFHYIPIIIAHFLLVLLFLFHSDNVTADTMDVSSHWSWWWHSQYHHQPYYRLRL